jgi:hypothetical protein
MLKSGLGAMVFDRPLVIGLLVISSALTMPAIAKPLPSDVAAIKADVDRHTHTFKSYQSKYFSEHGRFATSFKDVMAQPIIEDTPKLGADTKTFNYRIVPNAQSPNVTMIAAVPKQPNLPTIIVLMRGIHKKSSGGGADSSVSSVFCTSHTAGARIPSWQSIGKPDAITGFDCPTGF